MMTAEEAACAAIENNEVVKNSLREIKILIAKSVESGEFYCEYPIVSLTKDYDKFKAVRYILENYGYTVKTLNGKFNIYWNE